MRSLAHLAAPSKIGKVIELPVAEQLYTESVDLTDTLRCFENTMASGCNVSAVTPMCLRTLYDTIDYVPKAGTNIMGFCNYFNQTALKSDVDLFIQRCAPYANGINTDFKIIANGANGQGNLTAADEEMTLDVEGNLDAQTITGITAPTKIKTFDAGGSPHTPDACKPTYEHEPYLDWLSFMQSPPDTEIPQTMSTSYADDEQTAPASFATALWKRLAHSVPAA